MVGFQTKLKHARAGADLPQHPRPRKGAEFARLGGLHRNTFLNSPKLLDATLRLERDAAAALCRTDHRLRGLRRVGGDRTPRRPLRGGGTAWRAACCCRRRRPPTARCSATLPAATSRPSMHGPGSFQPMNVNFGLFPPLSRMPAKDADGNRLHGPAKSAAKKRALCIRALSDLEAWLAGSSSRSRGIIDVVSEARMNDVPDELAGRWHSGVVLKRDVFSTIERGRFRTETGEVEAVLRRLDGVPWWSRHRRLRTVPPRAPGARRCRPPWHRAAAVVCRKASPGARLDRRRAAAHRQTPWRRRLFPLGQRRPCASCIAPASPTTISPRSRTGSTPKITDKTMDRLAAPS